MNQAHWPFGKDPTCLARIHPGNATVSTPRTLAFRSRLHLEKAQDGNRSPKSGWIRVNQKDFQVLVQEKDSTTGLPVIQFLPDPSSPDRVIQRQASEKAQARQKVGLEAAALKSIVKEVLAEAGLIPAEAAAADDEDADTGDGSEDDSPESEMATSSALDADDDSPDETPRRKRSGTRQSRLKVSAEG